MNWQEIIIAMISFVSGGGLLGLFTLRQSRESKQIDNAAALVNEYRELLDQYKQEADDAREERDKSQKLIQELQAEVGRLKADLSILNEKMKLYQTMAEGAALLKCDRVNCQQRRPPMNQEDVERYINGGKE